METTLLCIIIDTHLLTWQKISERWNKSLSESFLGMLERLIMFINGFLALREDNGVMMISADAGESYFIMDNEEPFTFRQDQHSNHSGLSLITQKIIKGLETNLGNKKDLSKPARK
jgi:hypothetical protein